MKDVTNKGPSSMSGPSLARASRTGWLLAALVPLLLTGCTDAEHIRPADIAGEVLAQHVTEATMVSGFSISETRITLTSGEPPAITQLYPEPDEAVEPTVDPARPPHVRGGEFDVAAAAARATEALEGCGEEWGMVEVQVLTAAAVATRTTCEVEGQEIRTVQLNDDELPSLPGPITGGTLEQVWDEITAAGLAEAVTRVEFDGEVDRVRIQFSGDATDLTYEWARGLEVVDSAVQSHPSQPGPELGLADLPAADVAATLDEALAGLGDPGAAVRVAVEPAVTGTGPEIVLSDVEYNELARVPLG